MTDDDERMDRARRIREMREGSRPDDEDVQAADREDAGEDSPAEESADPEASATDGGSADAGSAGSGTDDADDGVDVDDADDGVDVDDADDGVDIDDADGGVEAGEAESTADVDDGDTAVDVDGGDTAMQVDDAESGGMHIPGAEVGDVEVDVAEMARQAGLESAEGAEGAPPVDGEEESAASGAAAGGAAAGEVTGAAARADVDEGESGEETRILEFTLGAEQYCLDIEYVEEIVKRETVTRVPNTPDCVEGVVDLRGQITTILDPKVLLDIDTEGSKDLIVVFDPDQFDDQGAVGWVVDDVDRVTPVTEDEVNSSPVDQDHINGVVDRDGEFVIWTTPELDVEEMAG